MRLTLFSVICATGLLVLHGCASQPATEPSGTLTITARWHGSPFQPRPIFTGSLGIERRLVEQSLLVDNDGGIENVLIYLEGSHVEESRLPPQPVTLSIRDGAISPRICTAGYRQEVQILQLDNREYAISAWPTTERVHVTQQSPPPSFAIYPEPMARRVGCQIHPWTRAFIWYFDDIKHAVTNGTGTATIAGLRPGKYVVVAWHERFGTRRTDVVVKQGGNTLTLGFTANDLKWK